MDRTGSYHKPAVHADIITPDHSNPSFYASGLIYPFLSSFTSLVITESDRFGPDFATQHHMERMEKKQYEDSLRSKKWFDSFQSALILFLFPSETQVEREKKHWESVTHLQDAEEKRVMSHYTKKGESGSAHL
jgi:hypothetical protein